MNGLEQDQRLIRELVRWTKSTPTAVAKKAGVAVTTINRPYRGTATTRISQPTLDKLQMAFPNFPHWADEQPDLPAPPPERDYVEVEVLPTFAGMGGGGTGEGDREIALVPRSLIVDQLKGQPGDFLLIDVRGDSMEPDFFQGDQILVDRRDRSPAQPGPFAIWDGEWGEYVVKNVERAANGEVRIFSTNSKYRAEVVQSENTRIIGRPVWFGRRL